MIAMDSRRRSIDVGEAGATKAELFREGAARWREGMHPRYVLAHTPAWHFGEGAVAPVLAPWSVGELSERRKENGG